MDPSESTWVHYIRMVEEGWLVDVRPRHPVWLRPVERQPEKMLMTASEVLVWEKAHGMTAPTARALLAAAE